MIDLALAVACGLAIGMIFKHASRLGLDRLSLITANYLSAFFISFLLLNTEGFQPGVELTILGLFTGGLFIAAFFVLALATAVAGMALAIAVMRLSVVIPFVASWVIWNEAPSTYQICGLIVAGAAFFLISRRSQETVVADPAPPQPHEAAPSKRTFLTLLLLFLMGGMIDTMMKTFDEVFAADHSTAAFMTMAFGVAFLLGLALVAGRRRRTDLRTVAWGFVLGAANVGSVEFFLSAIRQLSGPFVFPANNILLVIGSALLGVLFWREKLSRMNWLGVALAAIALILLNF